LDSLLLHRLAWRRDPDRCAQTWAEVRRWSTQHHSITAFWRRTTDNSQLGTLYLPVVIPRSHRTYRVQFCVAVKIVDLYVKSYYLGASTKAGKTLGSASWVLRLSFWFRHSDLASRYSSQGQQASRLRIHKFKAGLVGNPDNFSTFGGQPDRGRAFDNLISEPDTIFKSLT